MRIAELSRRSGVTVASIKFYVREGVLPRGELSSPNQASYGEEHLRRLRLIRALVEYGGLSLAEVRGIVEHVDAAQDDQTLALETTMQAVPTPTLPEPEPAADLADAEARVARLLVDHGWGDIGLEGVSGGRELVKAVEALQRLGLGAVLDRLDEYAEIAVRLGSVDVDTLADLATTDEVLEKAVLGTILGDVVMVSLRRLAQAAEALRRYGEQP